MKKITTDSYFQIGEQHIRSGMPCEDYALAKSTDNIAYAIVSDGCSSGGRTDVGARLITHSFARALENEVWQTYDTVTGFADSVVLNTELFLRSGKYLLGLTRSDMLATSLFAYVMDNEAGVKIYGDGVIAKVYKNGHIELSMYEWEDNTPFYLSYNDGELQSFIEAHGGDVQAKRIVEQRVHVLPSGERLNEYARYSTAEGILGRYIPISKGELENLKYIALFTDGVSQIDGVNWVDAVERFLAFRTNAGAFLKRRMIRQIKEYKKESKGPLDDIGAAVISFSEEV